jgi:hypothetical protein
MSANVVRSKSLSFIVLAVMVSIAALVLYWAIIDPVKPFYEDRIEQVSVEDTPTYHVLHIERYICSVEENIPIVVYTEIFGKTVHTIPPIEGLTHAGCYTENRRREIPRLLDGEYTWNTWVRACNPLRCVSHPLEAFSFTIQGGRLATTEKLADSSRARPRTGPTQ